MKTIIRTKHQTSARFSHKPDEVATKICELECLPKIKAKYHALASDIAGTVAEYTTIPSDRAEIAASYLLKLGYELAQKGVDIYRKN